MAAKGIAGWKKGEVRDDLKMTHPNMVEYVDLDDEAKQKDRDVVESIPDMAALSGETLKRERRIGVPRPMEGEAYEAFLAQLRRTPKTSRPVVVLPLDDAAMVRLACRLLDIGILVEALLDELRAVDVTALLLADVLRRAWRIHVVQAGNGRDSIEELVTELVNETGVIDVCP
jgi:hypothetical protein